MRHEWVKNDRTGCGKAMETLPGPKTAIKNSKIQKLLENSKIGNFVLSGGGPPIFPGEGSLFFRVGGLGAALLNFSLGILA